MRDAQDHCMHCGVVLTHENRHGHCADNQTPDTEGEHVSWLWMIDPQWGEWY
jgi:hypothetical protein